MEKSGGKPRILIVGASIAGLTAATALMQTNLVEVLVYERSNTYGAGRRPRNGGGIGLHDNSSQILSELGIRDFIKLPMKIQEDRDRTGRVIRRGQIPFSSAYWGDVVACLFEAATSSGAIVHYGKEVVQLEETEDKVKLIFADGTSETGDCVLGADGILSIVRSCMFASEKDLVRHSGFYLWRGLAELSQLPEKLTNEVKGIIREGTRTFAISRKSHAIFHYLPQGLNWGVYFNREETPTPSYYRREDVIGKITKEPTSEELTEMHQTVTKLYQPAISAVICATKGAFVNEIYDRDVLKTYHTSRCVLIGDAAHPTTPHFSRGVHMGIHDGYILSKAMARVILESQAPVGVVNFQEAFESYEAARLDYSNNVVLTARRLGRVKQGVFSSKQGVDWDLTCTTSQLNEMLDDNITDDSR